MSETYESIEVAQANDKGQFESICQGMAKEGYRPYPDSYNIVPAGNKFCYSMIFSKFVEVNNE